MAEPAAAYVATLPKAPAARVEPILDISDLRTWFFTRDGVVRAVDGVSFHVIPGETLAIVGESGCGKSVTALSVLRLIPSPPGRIVSGSIRFAGRDLLGLSEAQMREVRGTEISMIFQEPMTSLNPVLTLGRHAAAGDDRDGARLQPEAPDRRRADDRTRCDDPGADPRSDARAEAEDRRGDRADHARFGGRRRDGAARRRHVCRQEGRGSAGRDVVPPPAPPLHQGPPRLGAAARRHARGRTGAAFGRDSRHRAVVEGGDPGLSVRGTLFICDRHLPPRDAGIRGEGT